MKDKLIFDTLARKGDCWHIKHRCIAYDSSCQICRKRPCKNPDFSTWSGFGWIIERLPEWDRRNEFLAKMQCEYLSDWGDSLLFEYIDPIIMRVSLIKFIEGE